MMESKENSETETDKVETAHDENKELKLEKDRSTVSQVV